MSLQTRRPPGHAKRKALLYASDILSLRVQGHTYSAIREALEDEGVLVSISTVRREVLNGMTSAKSRQPADGLPARPLSLPSCGSTASPNPETPPPPVAQSLRGRTIAEEFMRGRSTNPLFLKESST